MGTSIDYRIATWPTRFWNTTDMGLFSNVLVSMFISSTQTDHASATDCSRLPSPTTSTTTTTTTTTAAECDPNEVNLLDSPQWQNEVGYWVGEYSFYGSDGNAYTSSSWNYPYDHYKGFITGNVRGNKYRQRNVFMYPPQTSTKCASDSSTQGSGTCGTNGNMKVFEADQTATTCSLNPELKGDIEGPFGSLSYTYTQLVGNDNALLYQVWLTKEKLNYYEGAILGNPFGRCTGGPSNWDCGYTSDRLLQSQLTTITKVTNSSTGATVVHRTRTAQGFDGFTSVGTTSYASYYREKQVSETEFWTQFNAAKTAYNILESDTCAWKNSDTGSTLSTGYTPGTSACKTHLEESFQL